MFSQAATDSRYFDGVCISIRERLHFTTRRQFGEGHTENKKRDNTGEKEITKSYILCSPDTINRINRLTIEWSSAGRLS